MIPLEDPTKAAGDSRTRVACAPDVSHEVDRIPQAFSVISLQSRPLSLGAAQIADIGRVTGNDATYSHDPTLSLD